MPNPYLSIMITLVLIVISCLFVWVVIGYINLRSKNAQLHYQIQEKDNAHNRLTRQYQSLEQCHEELIYSVSHDFRAPIRGISGFARILEPTMNVLDAEKRELFDFILGNARKMHSMLDDLVDYSRLIHHPMNPESVNLSSLLEDACRGFDKDEREIILKTETVPNITADGQLMKILLKHLLDNAVKFSQQDRPVRLKFRYQHHAFLLQDDGLGFNKKYIKKLFKLFSRLHNPDNFQGNGVGLASIKKIMQRHDGQAWIDSKQGSWTCVYLTFEPEQAARHYPQLSVPQGGTHAK